MSWKLVVPFLHRGMKIGKIAGKPKTGFKWLGRVFKEAGFDIFFEISRHLGLDTRKSCTRSQILI